MDEESRASSGMGIPLSTDWRGLGEGGDDVPYGRYDFVRKAVNRVSINAGPSE